MEFLCLLLKACIVFPRFNFPVFYRMKSDEFRLVFERLSERLRNVLSGNDASHDYWHIDRVLLNTRILLSEEKADAEICLLAALLHDVADYKYHGGDEEIGPRTAAQWLREENLPEEMIGRVVYIIENISFKGGNESALMNAELAVVQDADRLDAIGAVGIARAFSYGGKMGRPFFDPKIPPQLQLSKEEYKKSKAPTINHFYEKLLLLKDLMNTASARRLAEERHQFLLAFLEQWKTETGQSF
jgi:uncharacterized protein